jgi:hypothetical protein
VRWLWGCGILTEIKDEKAIDEAEETQAEALEKEEEKKKARTRKRGPYRKAHANW